MVPKYKCAWYGREFVVLDRWFPSSGEPRKVLPEQEAGETTVIRSRPRGRRCRRTR